MYVQYPIYFYLSGIAENLYWKRWFQNMCISVFPYNIIANEHLIKCLSIKTDRTETFTFQISMPPEYEPLQILYNNILSFLNTHVYPSFIDDHASKYMYKECLLDTHVIYLKKTYNLSTIEMKSLYVLLTIAFLLKLIKPSDYEYQQYKYTSIHNFIDIFTFNIKREYLKQIDIYHLDDKYETKVKYISKMV